MRSVLGQEGPERDHGPAHALGVGAGGLGPGHPGEVAAGAGGDRARLGQVRHVRSLDPQQSPHLVLEGGPSALRRRRIEQELALRLPGRHDGGARPGQHVHRVEGLLTRPREVVRRVAEALEGEGATGQRHHGGQRQAQVEHSPEPPRHEDLGHHQEGQQGEPRHHDQSSGGRRTLVLPVVAVVEHVAVGLVDEVGLGQQRLGHDLVGLAVGREGPGRVVGDRGREGVLDQGVVVGEDVVDVGQGLLVGGAGRRHEGREHQALVHLGPLGVVVAGKAVRVQGRALQQAAHHDLVQVRQVDLESLRVGDAACRLAPHGPHRAVVALDAQLDGRGERDDREAGERHPQPQEKRRARRPDAAGAYGP